MAEALKVLGQVKPAATTLTTLYAVPAATSAACSTLTICNIGAATTYRVAVRPAAEAINDKHYIVYDSSIGQYDTVFLTLGITLAATDVVSVYSVSGGTTFNLYGSELT